MIYDKQNTIQMWISRNLNPGTEIDDKHGVYHLKQLFHHDTGIGCSAKEFCDAMTNCGYEAREVDIEDWRFNVDSDRSPRLNPSARVGSLGSFFNWLKKYAEEESPRGDLAKDALTDFEFPINSSDREKIRGYIESRGACTECLEAFDKAYKQYRRCGKEKA